MVLEQIVLKGKASHGEIANEIVNNLISNRSEFIKNNNQSELIKKMLKYEQNIRRQMYDVLNVQLASGVITNQDKLLTPNNSFPFQNQIMSKSRKP